MSWYFYAKWPEQAGSREQDGRDAIDKMAGVVGSLEGEMNYMAGQRWPGLEHSQSSVRGKHG